MIGWWKPDAPVPEAEEPIRHGDMQSETALPIAQARVTTPSATATPTIREAKIIDFAYQFGSSDGGACYKLADNDGEGFTFLIANNGTITASLTCD